MKEDLNELREDIKRYMGMLKEDFQKNLNFVIDGQEDIKRDLRYQIDIVMKGQEEIRKELVAHRDNTEVHSKQAKPRRKMRS